MKPDFSEFSYGYAVTEELVSQSQAKIIAAPKFPSLIEEGKKGGGYDVSIPIRGKTMFLQFKLSDYLQRGNAKEHVNKILGVPYYRMHIRPLKHSNQHNLLLDLESKGEAVFYIAPEFHLPSELNNAYLNKNVFRNSAAFSPLDIGHLPDNNEHYLVFKKRSNFAYLCSDEPRQVKKHSLEDGIASLLHQHEVTSRDVNDEYFRLLNDKMLAILRNYEINVKIRKTDEEEEIIGISGIERIIEKRSPIEATVYIGRTFFDSELLVIPE